MSEEERTLDRCLSCQEELGCPAGLYCLVRCCKKLVHITCLWRYGAVTLAPNCLCCNLPIDDIRVLGKLPMAAHGAEDYQYEEERDELPDSVYAPVEDYYLTSREGRDLYGAPDEEYYLSSSERRESMESDDEPPDVDYTPVEEEYYLSSSERREGELDSDDEPPDVNYTPVEEEYYLSSSERREGELDSDDELPDVNHTPVEEEYYLSSSERREGVLVLRRVERGTSTGVPR
ncbi:hypothetical protein Pcinc_004268 [Petrolisthes cinctipes]|uniref:Uncharacterized protein n=1 Tax=Petrolisthes cinctipes TaxID=88211 RepID=A0AAE1GFN1_PETCI|nr:hypothetical protein Pcinc_004268 [Petrolisthes cinctipes]